MNTTLHVTVDKQTKDAAAKIAAEMGLDLSTVVKASLKSLVQTGVFHVERSFQMTAYLEKIIAQARKDLVAEKKISPSFVDSKSAIVWLKKHSK